MESKEVPGATPFVVWRTVNSASYRRRAETRAASRTVVPALMEGAVYDTNGQLVSVSFMDYSMPRAENLPDLMVGTTFTKCPSISSSIPRGH